MAQTALQLFDTQMALKDGRSQRCVPQRALGELLVAQLAYHQSCTRLLSGIMPQVSALLEEAEQRRKAIKEEQPADARLRSFLPRPQLRDEGSTLAEGWLLKGTFSLASDMNAVQGHLNRMKTMNKRWFVLCTDGKLYYYKSKEDAKTAKVPIDMNLVASVGAVNGPLEFELRVGARALRLKAELGGARSWMGALSAYPPRRGGARSGRRRQPRAIRAAGPRRPRPRYDRLSGGRRRRGDASRAQRVGAPLRGRAVAEVVVRRRRRRVDALALRDAPHLRATRRGSADAVVDARRRPLDARPVAAADQVRPCARRVSLDDQGRGA